MIRDIIKFAKLKDDVIIPSKRDEDGAYDLYANFDEEEIEIKPHETKMISTRIRTAFSEKYVMILKDRGSSGTIGMAQRCGVIDSSYRGEIFVPITNTTKISIFITKKVSKTEKNVNCIKYPYSKAICQFLMVEVPKMEVVEVSNEELDAMTSMRGNGCLGSSGK